MPLYLDRYSGSGTRDDSFRPAHSEGVLGAASADLRPDPMISAGRCLFYSPVSLPADVAGGLEPIADEPGDTLTLTRRTRIFNALGENFTGRNNKADSILKDLLFSPRSRWSPVQPSVQRSVKEIVLGGKVWASEEVAPMRQEDMDPADNFTRANETPLAGNWTKAIGSDSTFNLASNNILAVAGTSVGTTYWWNAAAFANDQFSEMAASNAGTNSDFGPTVRVSPSAYTMYFGQLKAPDNDPIYKIVNGTFTFLAGASALPDFPAGHVGSLDVEGSVLRMYRNRQITSSTTDTSIASGSAGILIYDTAARINLWRSGNGTSQENVDMLPVSPAPYIGDFGLGAVVEILFVTNGTLGGSPVIGVYAGNNTAEITPAQLTVNHDSRTGLNHVLITASTGNGYQIGTNYSFVITAGTVAGASVAGYVVGHFSIDARSAGIIDADALSNAAVAKIWAQVVDTYTALEVMRGVGASLGGKASGLATTTAVYRAINDSKARITATVDTVGNRSAIALDLTP